MFEEFASTLNIGDYSFDDVLSDEEQINAKKRLGRFIKTIREMSKQEKCYYCGRTFSSFCNSHSVPAFILRNIASNGYVYTSNAFINFPAIKIDKGVNQAGTFNLICRECDSQIFAEYENPNSYIDKPSQKMLAQIALKNNLMYIGKRKFEMNLYNQAEKELGMPPDMKEYRNGINEMDLNEFIKGYQKAKKALSKGTDEYYLCYYQNLDYVVPIAFQGAISLISDFHGQTVNDIFNESPSYMIKNINICVFPLESNTVIFMFIENGDKRYRNFYRQLRKMDIEDQLRAITYILLSYSEEVYFSKQIQNEVLSNKKLQEICGRIPSIVSPIPDFDALQVAKEKYNLSERHTIPNLLSREYKLR